MRPQPSVVGVTLAVLALLSGCGTSNSKPTFPTDPKPKLTLERVGQTTARAEGKLDIVFIHGLEGDARSTWTHSNGVFWPDWVAEDLSNANVWTLGYEAHLTKWQGGSMPLTDRATSVLNLLASKELGSKPIIIVAHSLGGLVAKKCLQIGITTIQG